MTKKLLMVGLAGLVYFGGTIAAGAVTTQNTDGNAEMISIEKAKEIAGHAAGGNVDSIELNKNDAGHQYYDIEIDQQGSFEDIDVIVDAKSGEVIKLEKEIADDEDDDDNDRLAAKQNVKISEVQAIATAIDDTPGKVMEVDLELDNGYYEIDIKTLNGEMEIKVDAESGKIIGKEMDGDLN